MRATAAAKRETHDHLPLRDFGPELQDFAHALTELCNHHGFGIADNPSLFVMEPEDRRLQYVVDGDGKLTLG